MGDDVAFDHVIPSVFDQRVAPSVAEAVSKAAREDGVCVRITDAQLCMRAHVSVRYILGR